MELNSETLAKAWAMATVGAADAAEQQTLQALCRKLESAAIAFQDLNMCYRIGKRPTEALFTRLDKAQATLVLMEGVKDGPK